MGENQQGVGESRTSDTGDDDSRIDRRAALKKAGAAAVAAGVVWSAPRIDGLSLVPDYAAAGTAAVAAITFNWNSDGPGAAGGSNRFSPRPGLGGYTMNGTCPGPGITANATLGLVGNATLTLPGATQADGNAFTGSVTFNIDPPFNKCQITAASFGPVTPAFFGDLPGGNFTLGPQPVPNNNSPFSVPFTMNARPNNCVRVDDCQVTIACL